AHIVSMKHVHTRHPSYLVIDTPDYIAPEHAMDSHQVDIRADLYSLGCTFYFLLCGRPPYAEYPLLKKLMMHQAGQPRLVRVVQRSEEHMSELQSRLELVC